MRLSRQIWECFQYVTLNIITKHTFTVVVWILCLAIKVIFWFLLGQYYFGNFQSIIELRKCDAWNVLRAKTVYKKGIFRKIDSFRILLVIFQPLFYMLKCL